MTTTITTARLAGRCANGFERGRGWVQHAVREGEWRALCGVAPGRLSAGWTEEPLDHQHFCPKCAHELKRLMP